MQGGLARNVTKADIPEPYIPAQGNERGGGVGTVAPGPQAGAAAAGAGHKGAVRRLFHTNDLDGTLIGFRLFVKHIENALGTGKGGQQKVALLGELVDGQSRLAHKHQIAGQAAQAGLAVHNHQPAQHGNDRIVDVGDGNNGGDHGGGIPLGAGSGALQASVQCLKTFQVGLLMVEHLDHLLPGGHLLHIAFQIAKSLLLAGVEETAAVGAEPDVPEHDGVPHHDQQRKPPVEHKQQNQRAHHLDKALDQQSKAVVQRVRDRVHVVREQAHQIALAVRVKVVQRQRLQMCEQVAADVLQNLLRGTDHELGVAQGRQCADDVDARGQRHNAGQIGGAAVFQHAVDDGADHVGAQQRGQRTDRRQQADDAEHDFVAAQIVHEAAQRVPQVLRALTAEWLRHLRRPLSSGNGKFPDRSYLLPAARHACPQHAAARRPE